VEAELGDMKQELGTVSAAVKRWNAEIREMQGDPQRSRTLSHPHSGTATNDPAMQQAVADHEGDAAMEAGDRTGFELPEAQLLALQRALEAQRNRQRQHDVHAIRNEQSRKLMGSIILGAVAGADVAYSAGLHFETRHGPGPLGDPQTFQVFMTIGFVLWGAVFGGILGALFHSTGDL
jgi:hypothetical protein